MTIDIALTLFVVGLTLVAFIREWASPDVLALSILCLLVILGLVGMGEMAMVFANPAPLTIAALFVMGGALEKSGAINQIGDLLKAKVNGGTRSSILAFTLVAAFFSAWMNNTAIVAILLPVVLGFARSKEIAASKLLIPLSYSSILGGCCTLIGTSTNLIVNGSLKELGLEPLNMFTIAPVGIPIAIAGIAYLTIFGPKLLPSRSSITGSLDIDLRTFPLRHILIQEDSPLLGQPLLKTALGTKGVQVLEVRRRGARLMDALDEVVIEKNDRFLVGFHSRSGKKTDPQDFLHKIGARQLSEIDGLVSELVIPAESSISGQTLAATDFRQRYNSVVLAVHRGGKNITNQLASLPLDRGDTLLVLTSESNLKELQGTRDFVLTDAPFREIEVISAKSRARTWPITFSWSVLIAVVLTVSISDLLSGYMAAVPSIPIHFAAIVGVLALLWAKILSPREAYGSIDWQVLLMLYGLLGLGMAMQSSGTAEWLGNGMVDFASGLVAKEYLPYLLLWMLFLFTSVLTEILSNNATAVMLVPIAAKIAEGLESDPRPFIIAITIAASCAFTLPMGYQTHMMVYGPGGYKFSDYARIGIPLNLMVWVMSCLIIPLIWSF